MPASIIGKLKGIFNFGGDTMRLDDLAASEIAEVARESSIRNGLTADISIMNSDEVVVRLSNPNREPRAAERQSITWRTWGTGAFLANFDNRYLWQEFAYDRTSQEAAIEALSQVSRNYLAGNGASRSARFLTVKQHYLMVPYGDERAALKKVRQRRGR